MKYGPVFSGGEGGEGVSHTSHFHFKLAPVKKRKANDNKCSLKEKSWVFPAFPFSSRGQVQIQGDVFVLLNRDF